MQQLPFYIKQQKNERRASKIVVKERQTDRQTETDRQTDGGSDRETETENASDGIDAFCWGLLANSAMAVPLPEVNLTCLI